MRSVLKIWLALFFPVMLYGQNRFIDSIQSKLKTITTDTGRVEALGDLCFYYRYVNIDSAIMFGNKAYDLSLSIQFLRGQALALNDLGLAYREYGDLSKSLELQLKALKICNDNNFILERGLCYRRIGLIYMDLNNWELARDYHFKAVQDHMAINSKRNLTIEYENLGRIYMEKNDQDSSRMFLNKALQWQSYAIDLNPDLYNILLKLEHKIGNDNGGLLAFREGIRWAEEFSDYRNLCSIYFDGAKLYNDQKKYDSAEYFANKSVEAGQKINFRLGLYKVYSFLSTFYDERDPKKALSYLKLANTVKESLFGAGNIQVLQNLVARENQRQLEVQNAQDVFKNRLKIYGLSGGVFFLMIILIYFFRNNIRQKKVNLLLNKQKAEIEVTLQKLQETQKQLIQSEKMASLGELTAGIAHEIQNPLNFVNNFSEVNTELLAELKEEIKKGNLDEVNAIADDVISNEEKINHHGKRADAIVKGMLQHSRSSSGVKEPTDINALADEYLRLAYHGLRAKDKSFNATMQTDFDPHVGNINVISQDMGRVILNLITNAFYAVTDRKKLNEQDYEPTVSVKTQRQNGKVIITVRDNGMGIPDAVKEKIFQPFFTTKPTGQGTGLGLSMSYDIVTKGHGGGLTVNTQEGEYTEFNIVLPI